MVAEHIFIVSPLKSPMPRLVSSDMMKFLPSGLNAATSKCVPLIFANSDGPKPEILFPLKRGLEGL